MILIFLRPINPKKKPGCFRSAGFRTIVDL